MDLERKYEFEELNKGKVWEDKCGTCCVLQCGLFADFDKQCHCSNFKSSSYGCKKCRYREMSY